MHKETGLSVTAWETEAFNFLCSEDDLEFLLILSAGVTGRDRYVWFRKLFGLSPQLHAC